MESVARLENENARSVTDERNVKAQGFVEKVFDVGDGNWRGIGRTPKSAYKLKGAFSEYDARLKYEIKTGLKSCMDDKCWCQGRGFF